MTKNNDNIYKLWHKIYQQIKILCQQSNEENVRLLNDCGDFELMISSLKKGIGIILIIILLIFVICIISVSYNIHYGEVIETKNITIQHRDSMLITYLGATVDSSGDYSWHSYYRDGKLLTYTQMYQDIDSLQNVNFDLRMKNIDMQYKISELNLLISILEKYKKIEYDSSRYIYSYRSKNDQILTYDDLCNLYDSLNIVHLRDKTKLDYVTQKYNLIWEETDSIISVYSANIKK